MTFSWTKKKRGACFWGFFAKWFPGPLDMQTSSLLPLHAVAEIQMYLEEYRENVLAQAAGSRNRSLTRARVKEHFLSCFCHVQGAGISEAWLCTAATMPAFMLAFNLFFLIISNTIIIFCLHRFPVPNAPAPPWAKTYCPIKTSSSGQPGRAGCNDRKEKAGG